MNSLANYWESVRDLYYVFESGLKASTAEVYEHEMPGGQYSNLRPRAIQLGLGDRWQEIKRKYREVNDALGDVIKVTPTSKMVADFAMFLVQNDLSVEEAIAQADVVAGFETVLKPVSRWIKGEALPMRYRDQEDVLDDVAAWIVDPKAPLPSGADRRARTVIGDAAKIGAAD